VELKILSRKQKLSDIPAVRVLLSVAAFFALIFLAIFLGR